MSISSLDFILPGYDSSSSLLRGFTVSTFTVIVLSMAVCSFEEQERRNRLKNKHNVFNPFSI